MGCDPAIWCSIRPSIQNPEGIPVREWRQASGSIASCSIMRQPSPAATRQLLPFGVVMMIVQVSPSPVESTSTRPPLLATPMATGASEYWFLGNSRTWSRHPGSQKTPRRTTNAPFPSCRRGLCPPPSTRRAGPYWTWRRRSWRTWGRRRRPRRGRGAASPRTFRGA